jgi:hypothetical protein
VRRLGSLLSVVVAAVLAVGGLAAVSTPVQSAAAAATGLNPVRVWSRSFPGVTFRESSPVPANLSTEAAVVGALDGKVYAFDLATGATEPGWPVTTTDPVNSSPAAADVLGNGHDEIFVGSGEAATSVAAACSGGGTYAIDYTGAVIWHNIGSDPDCANQAFHSSFAIGDTTAPGAAPSATIGALGLQSPSYNAASGVMNAGWPFYTDDTVFSSPALADLTGSGVDDIIMGGDSTPGGVINYRGGMMRAITGAGKLLWSFPTDEQVRSSPAIGDVGTMTTPSIVFGTGDFWQDNGGGTQDSTSIFSLNFGGSLQWRKDLGGNTLAGPALADVEGNGQADIIEGTSGSPGNPNGGLVWVLDGQGNALPNWAGHPSGGGVVIGGISTADLTGSGYQDLLVPTGAGVFIYDGRSGAQLAGLAIGQIGYQNTPLVTDDGNGAIGVTTAGTQPDGTGVVEHWRFPGGSLGSIGWPMFHHDPAHTGDLATAAPACVPGAASISPAGLVTRVAGADRDQTAIDISQSEFAAGSAKSVVLASDAAFPDALAGGPLAASRSGPLLVTPPVALAPAVLAEIQRVLPILSTVYILGGPSAISPTVDTSLTAAGYLVDRLAGTDRFGTAAAIAAAMGNPKVAVEVDGLNFPDALSAGPLAIARGGAILLTAGSDQSAATAAYLAANQPTRIAVGGPAATADPSATPIVGADRYATAVDVAQTFSSPPVVGLATGTGFADALAGGPAVGSAGGPLLLVPGCGAVPASVTGYLVSVAAGLHKAELFGGTSAVGDDVEGEVDSAVG